MYSLPISKPNNLFRKVISCVIAFSFVFSVVIPPQLVQAQSVLNLPAPGTMIPPSPGYVPVQIKGLTIHPENPLQFDFIVNAGDTGKRGLALEDESSKLIKYFLASLTVPEDQMWVNLSPYENDRIISTGFGQTEMGRDLLAQDYLLKQLTSSLTYPEDDLGQKFWERVYAKAKDMYGTTDIPLNTFNKVWIVPDKAVVLQEGNSAFVLQSHLKVMLEEDYVALEKNKDNDSIGLDMLKQDDAEIVSGISSDVVREVLLPEIEKEVNEGKNFALLRQVFNSGILAAWFKRNLKESLLGQVYVDKNKVKGIDLNDPQTNEEIYQQYLEAFQKGVFNYIRDDYDPQTNDVIPRKYFSGGARLDFSMLQTVKANNKAQLSQVMTQAMRNDYYRLFTNVETAPLGAWAKVTTDLKDLGPNAAGSASIAMAVDNAMTGLRERIRNQNLASEQRRSARRDSAMLVYNLQDPKLVLTQITKYEKEKKVRDVTKEFIPEMKKAYDFLGRSPSEKFSVKLINNGETSFGAAKVDNVLYVEKSLIDIGQKKGDPFDVKGRIFVRLLTDGTPEEARINEYNYAKKINPDGIKKILPRSDLSIEDIYASVSDSILRAVDISDVKQMLENKNLATDYNLNIDRVILPAGEARGLYEELLKEAHNALYTIAFNVINGEVDLHKRINIPGKEVVFSPNDIEVQEGVTFGMLAFAANPAHLAHGIVAILKAMAQSKADYFAAVPTFGDFRKPILQKTWEQRKQITEQFIDHAFQGLIQVMDILPYPYETIQGGKGVNGEEKVLPLIDLNKEAGLKKFTFFYGAGGDHYLAFAREKDGHVKFAEITKDNIADFKYYAEMSGYSSLINQLINLDSDAIGNKNLQYIQDIRNNGYQVKLGKYFPVLDVIAKLWLIQKEARTKGADVSIRMLNTARGAVLPDKLREKLVFEADDRVNVVNNAGLEEDVSATLIRNALLSITLGVLDIDGLRAIPKKTLIALLDPSPQRRQYLRILIKEIKNKEGAGIILPNSLEALLPTDIKKEEERRSTLREELMNDFRSKFNVQNVRISEKIIQKENVTRLKAVVGRTKLSVNYAVWNSNNRENIMVGLMDMNFPDTWSKTKKELAERIIKLYIKNVANVEELNVANITKVVANSSFERKFEEDKKTIQGLIEKNENFGLDFDQAMTQIQPKVTTPVATATTEPKYGGIDLDPRLLDLQIKRDDNGIPLPVMQQPIKQMHIEGFIPVIINIQPVTELPLLLGKLGDTNNKDKSSGLSFRAVEKKDRFELSQAE